MLGMLNDKKKIAAIIVSGGHKEEDPKVEALKSAAEELKEGLKMDDPMAIVEPLKAIIQMCLAEQEGEEEEAEGY